VVKMYTKENILVYLAGVYNVLLGIFHLLFWKIQLFNWEVELKQMSSINSGVLQIMNLCLIVIFFFMAFISFFHNKELINTSLGKSILIGFSIFWLLRFIEQFLFFGYNGMLFPLIFLIGFFLYLIPTVIVVTK